MVLKSKVSTYPSDLALKLLFLEVLAIIGIDYWTGHEFFLIPLSLSRILFLELVLTSCLLNPFLVFARMRTLSNL